MKNGKLKRGIIIACIPFIFAIVFGLGKTYFGVEYMRKKFIKIELALERIPTGLEMQDYVKTYDKYVKLKLKKDRGDELNIGEQNNLLDWYEKLENYTRKWRPTREGTVNIIIP